LGIDVDKSVATETKKKEQSSTFEFKDPKEYENMSKEERKTLTEQMMKQHKTWAGSTLNEKPA